MQHEKKRKHETKSAFNNQRRGAALQHKGRAWLVAPPDVTPKNFRLEGLVNGQWQELKLIRQNYQRLVNVPIKKELEGISFVLEHTWGGAESRVYAFYID